MQCLRKDRAVCPSHLCDDRMHTLYTKDRCYYEVTVNLPSYVEVQKVTLYHVLWFQHFPLGCTVLVFVASTCLMAVQLLSKKEKKTPAIQHWGNKTLHGTCHFSDSSSVREFIYLFSRHFLPFKVVKKKKKTDEVHIAVNFILFFPFSGTIGFFACFWFVNKIYSVVKVD